MKKVLELYANFQKSIVVKWQSHEYENGSNAHTRHAWKRSLLEYMVHEKPYVLLKWEPK